MHGDRIVRLAAVPVRHRETVHQLLTTLYRSMLRRQQDILDQQSERGPNWEAWLRKP
jgi:hypothetical protein